MSVQEQHHYRKTSPELRSYYASLISNLDLTSTPVLQTPPISEPGPDPKQSSAAISPNPLPSPTHAAAPATPRDELIAKKLEPVLAHLTTTEDELAKLKVNAHSQPKLTETDSIELKPGKETSRKGGWEND